MIAPPPVIHPLVWSEAVLHAVLPGDVDTVPSGGNVYDRRVLTELRQRGWDVHEHPLAGTWPRPDLATRRTLAAVLDGIGEGAAVLLDGLVACGVPELLAPHSRRLRMAMLVHLPLADEVGRPSAVVADLHARERAALGHAHAVVTTSRWTAYRLVARHGIEPGRVHVVPPGVDPAGVARGSAVTGAPPRLCCVGALTPTKGQDVQVAALARLADLRWTAALVGPQSRDPGFVRTLRGAIARHGLADRVTMTGVRRGAAFDAELEVADLLVLPSRVEAYGMVVPEALARGIPVVASAVGGVSEAMGADGPLPGVCVPPGDASALVAALHGPLQDPAVRGEWRIRALGRRGRLATWSIATGRLASVW